MRTLRHYLLHQHRYENVVRWEPDPDINGWTTIYRCARCGHTRRTYFANSGTRTP